MTTRPLVVEFMGLPGSGKTTLAQMLTERLHDETGLVSLSLDQAMKRSLRQLRDSKARWVAALLPIVSARQASSLVARSTDQIRSMTSFAVKYPGAFAAIGRALARRGDLNLDPEFTVYWFLSLAYRYEIASRVFRPQDVLILGEGFAQRIVGLLGHAYEESDEADLTAYIEAVPRPDLLVHTRAPLEICIQRVTAENRHSKGRLRSANTKSTLPAFFEGLDACAHQTASIARTLGWAVLSVENTGSIETAVSAITSSLLQLVDDPMGS